MINFKDSQIIQILPEYFVTQASVKALSFALSRAIKKFVYYCDNIDVFAAIDAAPEHILDILALELNTQYYDGNLEIGIKRNLVRNTMIWYMGAGTPKAVEELVVTIFGNGGVQEWFEYGGSPYCFKAWTEADIDVEEMEKFSSMIEKVKNARSHLESMDFYRAVPQNLYSCNLCIAESEITIGWGY
ncbi:MAG: phage tail protein [bacterium]|nr:phage tail protein [bacterium]